MKIKHEMILAQVGEDYVAVTVGDRRDDFNGMVRLNGTGKDIWDGLAKGLSEEQIVEDLLEKYDVDRPRAAAAVRSVIEKLAAEGILEL